MHSGRADLLKFADEQNIPVSSTPKAPWSMDDNIIHCSYEAGVSRPRPSQPRIGIVLTHTDP